MLADPALSVRITPPFVWPLRTICFVVLIPVVHVQDPLGMITVSPLTAALIALWTSVLEQLAAVVVAPAAGAMEHVQSARAMAANRGISLMIALCLGSVSLG